MPNDEIEKAKQDPVPQDTRAALLREFRLDAYRFSKQEFGGYTFAIVTSLGGIAALLYATDRAFNIVQEVARKSTWENVASLLSFTILFIAVAVTLARLCFMLFKVYLVQTNSFARSKAYARLARAYLLTEENPSWEKLEKLIINMTDTNNSLAHTLNANEMESPLFSVFGRQRGGSEGTEAAPVRVEKLGDSTSRNSPNQEHLRA